MENYEFDNELLNELHQFFLIKDKGLEYCLEDYFELFYLELFYFDDDEDKVYFEEEYKEQIKKMYEMNIPEFLKFLHRIDRIVDEELTEYRYNEYVSAHSWMERYDDYNNIYIQDILPYPSSSYEQKFKEIYKQFSFLSYDEIKPLFDEVMNFYIQCQTFIYRTSEIEILNIYQKECNILSFIIRMIDCFMNKQYQKKQSYKEFKEYSSTGHFKKDREDYEEFLDEQSVFSEENDYEQANIEQHNLEKMEHGKKKDKERRNSKKSKKELLRFGKKKYEKSLPKPRHISRHQKKQSLISFEF